MAVWVYGVGEAIVIFLLQGTACPSNRKQDSSRPSGVRWGVGFKRARPAPADLGKTGEQSSAYEGGTMVRSVERLVVPRATRNGVFSTAR
ncbi:uncharacterized protein B0H64DRAFT_38289 [Chaetomium fimeti]|uniref:Secreted protein n=1 Tax=Chaetomium fimeti TaxID=1854472 RepID=A0AAE0HRP1_9PEZI|nr:hypothetical protein B0H64DRAFT_38289 [Chaetomium fimeti]